MKKLQILSLLWLGVTFLGIHADTDSTSTAKGGDATGHSFFWVRPPFQDMMPEKISLFRSTRALARDCSWGGAFQVVPFGGRSTRAKGLARYFTFGGKDTLTVNTDQTTFPDINPTNFNVVYTGGSFQSTLQFRPRQSYAGVGLDYLQYIGWGDCCERNWWFEISSPVEWVRNNMNLTETATASTGTLAAGAAPNMTAAFTGTYTFITGVAQTMNFGRIDGARKKTRLADIQLKLGYDYQCSDCSWFDAYLGLLIPTGNKPNGKYMFEAIVGENRHFGFLTGASMGFNIWQRCDSRLYATVDMNSRYLIRNTQTRSFDLKFRPWSRYMLVYLDAAGANAPNAAPGINIFTRKMKVHPHFQHNMTAALYYEGGCGLLAEAGYNVWCRQGEKVQLSDPWVTGPAIAALDSTNALLGNQTNRLSNIGNNNAGAELPNPAAALPANLLIQESDLDLGSAAVPAALSHIFYGTLGYGWDTCWPITLGIGGSYEFSRINTALSRWMVWGKFGVSL